MLRGWDGADRVSRGESERFASDVHTLKAGLVRLSLAAVATHRVDAGLAEGAGCDGVPPWRDRDSADLEELDRFVAFVDDLHRDLLRPPAGSLLEQGRRFLSLCDAWMDASSDPVEDSLRRAVAEGVGNFALRGDEPVDPAELGEVLRSMLEDELPAAGSAWTGALTFAPLRPGHILPHGLMVVAGLDESFPGEPRTATLDLLSRHRILGDSDPVAENRHAFLLALLSARCRLLLSWTSRDLRKDVMLAPSSVLLELESALREGFLGTDSAESGVRRAVPLLARTGGVLENDPPAWCVPSWNPDDSPRACAPRQEAPAPVPASPSLENLSSFLQSPWLYRVGANLERQEDDASETNSPLSPDMLRFHGLCTDALDIFWNKERVGAGASMDGMGIARELLRSAAWEEGIPERDFFQAAADALGKWISDMGGALLEHLGEGVELRRQTLLTDLFPPGVPGIAALPAARVRWMAGGGGSGRCVFADLVSYGARSPRPEKKAKLYLAGAWMRAAGWTGPIDLIWIERMKDGRVEKEPLPDSASAEWLRDLLADCRDPLRSQHVPLHAAVGKVGTRPSMEAVMEDENRHRSELERLLEPRLPDLPEAELMELVNRWFRPWRAS